MRKWLSRSRNRNREREARYANIAMLGGVRGALSTALVATLTTSAVLSQKVSTS